MRTRMRRKILVLGAGPSGPPVAPPSPQSFSDNFNRADSTGLGANWTALVGSFDIVSNQVIPHAVSASVAPSIWTAPCNTADQYSQVELSVLPSNTNKASWAIVRCDGTANNYYGARLTFAGGLSGYYALTIRKRVAGSETTLVTSPAFPLSAGAVLRLEVKGDQLFAYVGGNLWLLAVDTSLPSGGYVGVAYSQTTGTITHKLDNWSAGDLTSQSTQPLILFGKGQWKSPVSSVDVEMVGVGGPTSSLGSVGGGGGGPYGRWNAVSVVSGTIYDVAAGGALNFGNAYAGPFFKDNPTSGSTVTLACAQGGQASTNTAGAGGVAPALGVGGVTHTPAIARDGGRGGAGTNVATAGGGAAGAAAAGGNASGSTPGAGSAPGANGGAIGSAGVDPGGGCGDTYTPPGGVQGDPYGGGRGEIRIWY